MTIPFADLLNKAKARLFPAAADITPAQPRPAPMEKPSSGRLGKTVLPNTIRTVTSPDPMKVATAPARVAKAASASELRPVEASSRPAAAHSRQLPRASVLGLEPKMERTISLQLADILEQMPAGYVKSQETFDPARSIALSASEIEKGMAESKPSVSLASIYQEAPEIFARRLSPADSACVPLPYEKVLEQFRSLRVRPDQVHDHTVPQFDTPFLKVTIEDTERFGTTMEPLQTSSLPPMRMEPATAETIAAAAPEPIASETIKRRPPPLLRPSISSHDPVLKKLEASQTKAPAHVGPKKNSIHLPPNGTGAPASERVPASSGPPVPTSLPAPPRAGETRFTNVTAPCEDVRPKFQRGSPARPAREVAAALSPPKRDETKIALALNRLLQEVPAFQLNGSPSAVPENVRVELPLSLIEPQLASGRVVVSPTLLQKAMPEIYRELLKIDPVETPVSLPLQAILKNLPTTVLRMRDDQEEIVLKEAIETPFSIKADEDAKRFQGAEHVPKVSEQSPEQTRVEVVASAKEKKLDAKSVVARANALPGVAACAITFTDGLSLAGNLPAELAADGLCAVAPSVLQKIDKHMVGTRLGPFRAVTLHAGKSPLTFIMHGNICLAALHAGDELTSESRNQLAAMVEELSQTYSQLEPAHVDH